MTKSLLGNEGAVRGLQVTRLDWTTEKNGHQVMQEILGSETEFKADLVLLAMGFVHPVQDGLLDSLGVQYDQRGNIAANTGDYKTSVENFFAAGDARRGQSLVVWAIREGRECAASIDSCLRD